MRDKETGKSKGFGWLKYEDQRSTDLAVDNLGGAEVGGRLLRVDHARYQARDDEDQDEYKIGWEDVQRREGKPVSDDEMSEEEEIQRPVLPEERELALLMRDHDNDDPMKGFLIDEKKKEVEEARRRADGKEKSDRHRHHRSRREKGDDGRHERSRRKEGSEREKRPLEGDSKRERYRDGSRERHRRHRDTSRGDPQERQKRREKESENRRSHRRDEDSKSHGRNDDRRNDDRERHRKRREDDDDGHGRNRSRSPRRRQD